MPFFLIGLDVNRDLLVMHVRCKCLEGRQSDENPSPKHHGDARGGIIEIFMKMTHDFFMRRRFFVGRLSVAGVPAREFLGLGFLKPIEFAML
jgi:hypothetical protein